MNKKNNAGFTLFELMIVLAIASILTIMALPNLKEFVHDNRVTAVTNKAVQILYYARSEAAKSGHPISICASNFLLSSCEEGNLSLNGYWIMFNDYDVDGDRAASTTTTTAAMGNLDQENIESILLRGDKPREDFDTQLNLGQFGENKNFMTIFPNGTFRFGKQAVTLGSTISIVDSATDKVEAKVVINGSGRIKSCRIDHSKASC